MTVGLVGADDAIFGALEQPMTVREVYQALLVERWQTYADHVGVELELNERGLPAISVMGLPFALLAWGHWEDNGRYPSQEPVGVYRRLVRLERLGLVDRVRPSPRRTLWFRVAA